jgi:nitrogen regulatory protein PII
MRPLEQKKLLTIITARELEKRIIETARRRGVGGYTVVQASGAGASGIQSGMLDVDSNILIYIILSEARLMPLLEDIDEMMRRGHRLKAIISDITILPRKPVSPTATGPD